MRYLLIFVILILCCCNIENRIKNKIPIGSKLSKEILLGAHQIVKDKENLIITYNFDRIESQSMYLLFFNKNLEFIQFQELYSEEIDSIRNDSIFCTLNENKFNASLLKSNRTLPFNYNLVMKKLDFNSSGFRNKTIDDFFFNKSKDSVCFKVKNYNCNIYSNNSKRYNIDSNSLVDNPRYDIKNVNVSLYKILFNFDSEDIISVYSLDSNNHLTYDKLLFINKNQSDNFRNEICNIIFDK